jgi:hypothetical protein
VPGLCRHGGKKSRQCFLLQNCNGINKVLAEPELQTQNPLGFVSNQLRFPSRIIYFAFLLEYQTIHYLNTEVGRRRFQDGD